MSDTIPVHAIHVDTVRRMNWTPLNQSMPARMERARQYRFERDRLLCVGAGLLMSRVLGIHDESELRLENSASPVRRAILLLACRTAATGASSPCILTT